MKPKLKHKQNIIRAGGVAATLLIVWISTSLAQLPPCTVDIPVNVILPDGALIRQLRVGGFVVRSKKETLPIQLLTNDIGPRRILFVVETGKNIPMPARRIETSVISEILVKARPEDSFALLTTRGTRKEVGFHSNQEELKAILGELEIMPHGKDREDGVLDRLLEATDLFNQPQPGDSIVLMTMGIESAHRTSYSKVQAALAAGRIRLFGFQLGQIIGGYYETGVSLGQNGQLLPTASIAPNRENLFALSQESGGIVFLENTQGAPWREYKVTDETIMKVQRSAIQIYKAVMEYYRLQFQSPSRNFIVDLADPIRSQIPKARVMFPTHILDCRTGTSAGVNQ